MLLELEVGQRLLLVEEECSLRRAVLLLLLALKLAVAGRALLCAPAFALYAGRQTWPAIDECHELICRNGSSVQSYTRAQEGRCDWVKFNSGRILLRMNWLSAYEIGQLQYLVHHWKQTICMEKQK